MIFNFGSMGLQERGCGIFLRGPVKGALRKFYLMIVINQWENTTSSLEEEEKKKKLDKHKQQYLFKNQQKEA